MSDVPKIYAAMHAIMKDIPFIEKEQKAPEDYLFRGIEDALRFAHPKFLDHDVICIPHVRNTTREQHSVNNKFTLFTVVEVDYNFYSTIDGSSVTSAVSGEGMCYYKDKSTAIAMSNAFKTMMWQTFCIPVDGKELDGENTTEPQGDSKPSNTRAPGKPPQGAKNAPNTQDKPLARDIGIIVNTLAKLPRDCKVWLYDNAPISASDKPPNKFTNTEAMEMIELMREHYADEMVESTPQAETQDDHNDEPEYITVQPCPKCGGDMWDNSGKRKEAQAAFKAGTRTGKPPPAFKCKDENCDGIVWPAHEGDK